MQLLKEKIIISDICNQLRLLAIQPKLRYVETPLKDSSKAIKGGHVTVRVYGTKCNAESLSG